MKRIMVIVIAVTLAAFASVGSAYALIVTM